MQRYGLTPDGEQIIINRFHGGVETHTSTDPEKEHDFLFLDVETTGLAAGIDPIIELAIARVTVNVDTGKIVGHQITASWFEDPGFPVPPEITELTGIKTEDVAGKKIPEAEVRALFENAKLVVTHNARFDRAACVARFGWLTDKGMPMWACSVNQVDWRGYGHKHADLETLCRDHGFFYDAHRATIDVEAMLRLLAMSPEEDKRPYICDIIDDVRREYYLVAAAGTPYAAKDELRARRYRWDSENRQWYTSITTDSLDEEMSWVAEVCEKYGGGKAVKAKLPRSSRFDDSYKPKWKGA